MHLNVEQILWALVLAGHLVLLIVLLGRDRTNRFPWFTAAIALSSIRLIADHMLHGKLTNLAFYWQSYTGMALEAVLGVLVLVELLRPVFSSGKAGLILKVKGWAGWTLVTGGIAAGAVWAWGPWPTWQGMNAQPGQLPLLVVLLIGMKGQLFLALATVEVGLLMRIFGKRFGFGWRSYPQLIMLGLSTNALGLLTVQGITEAIRRTIHLTSREQYEHVVKLFNNLENARSALWILVLVWWIFWLWRDEPETHLQAFVPAEVPEIGDQVSTEQISTERAFTEIHAEEADGSELQS